MKHDRRRHAEHSCKLRLLRCKWWLFRHSFSIFLILLLPLGVLLIFWWMCSPAEDWRARISLGVATLSLFYFLQKQSLEETRLMKELITDFNGRYGGMDRTLQGILRMKCVRPALPLSPRQQQTLVDYFNLCAEEYLFYDLGYVEKRVWDAWANGMREYAKDERIQKLWKKENESKSYYDFDFPHRSEEDRGEPRP